MVGNRSKDALRYNLSMTGIRAPLTALWFASIVWTLAASGSISLQKSGPHANSSAAGVELTIVASEALSSPLTQLARQFEQKTGNRIRFVFVDSASLIQQIQNGSALDAVFLPDMDAARHLAASGTVTSVSITEYARDPMVLCIAPGVRIQPRPGNPLLLLTDKRLAHIAIASPHDTAFGKITVQALTAAHIYDFELRRKLLVGGDIAQVAQFLEKGNADVALLPGIAISAYQLTNIQMLPLASKLYNPMRMGAAVLQRSKHPRQALEFLRFAVSPDGRKVFREAGFEEPPRPAAGKH
jgi:molybdate transport system substrate-binding protein